LLFIARRDSAGWKKEFGEMENQATSNPGTGKKQVERRSLFSRFSTLAMLSGLVGGYGAFAFIAGRFLYPARPARKRWMFVVDAATVAVGQSLLYRGPTGETISITRQERNGSERDFIALSSTCPHLGCQVHWEAHNDRYFCPCHNGEFDSAGRGYAGPPGEAGMSLPRYPLKVDRDLLYIELPTDTLTAESARGELIERVEGIHGPGHDPCLARLGPPVRPGRAEV
jgi:nitrite reductase/ring-hydroxylating ferredoxin subunit